MDNTLHVKTHKIKTVTKVYPKSIIIALVFIVQEIIEMNMYNSYFDEAIGVASVMLVVIFVFTGKMTKYDQSTIILIAVVVAIGLLGNAVYQINDSIFSVLIDVLTQLKVFVPYFAIRYFLTETEKKATIDYLTPIAKLYILVCFILCIVNLFANIGMDGGYRYGIKIFRFVFDFNHQYAASIIFMFGIVVCNEKIGERLKHFYFIIGAIAILSALKTLSVISVSAFVFLSVYYKKYQTISLKIIIPMIFVMVLMSSFQINTYILNTHSPRRMFIDYAIKNANDHFPLGSGFGTYGSAEASKHYSKLYYEYHFNKRWGMTPSDKRYLHDNYWQTILGQFGWFGFLTYIVIYIRWFFTSYTLNTKSYIRAYVNAVFLAMIVFALGSAAISSSPGLLCLAPLALYSNPEERTKENSRKIKIRI